MKKAIIIFTFIQSIAFGQDTSSIKPPVPKKSNWYDKISIRGYTQVRYNRLLETNPALKCDQCDRSWGENGGFFLRRLRVIFFGQISERVYYYFQPDFASSASTTGLHFGQIRDMYFDIGVDRKNEFRFRIGQSKVPFGFENMQSSQNRLPLDRNDALNSAVPNERDLGVFFYWAPQSKRQFFSNAIREGLKGSGDYGIFALGVYNGQTANRPELNNNPHIVARLTYPIEWKGQVIEPSIQAYTGTTKLGTDQLSTGVKFKKDLSYTDRRIAATLNIYPKPIGLLAEYNIGQTPGYNNTTDSIEVQDLKGGFVTLYYKTNIKNHLLYPFVRYQYFDGAKKLERDARSYTVKELELGIEWQPFPSFELTAMYTISNRRFEDFTLQNNHQVGNLLRLQAQVNF